MIFIQERLIMNYENIIREHLLQLLHGGNAHLSFDRAINQFPLEYINEKVSKIDYSAWQLMEHIHIAQWDILEFVKNPNHVSPKWPDDYWPTPHVVADHQDWENTWKQFQLDMNDVIELVKNPDTDFFTPIPHAKDYTIFRELLTVADHNAYHIAEIAMLRQVMDIWPEDNGYLTGTND